MILFARSARRVAMNRFLESEMRDRARAILAGLTVPRLEEFIDKFGKPDQARQSAKGIVLDVTEQKAVPQKCPTENCPDCGRSKERWTNVAGKDICICGYRWEVLMPSTPAKTEPSPRHPSDFLQVLLHHVRRGELRIAEKIILEAMEGNGTPAKTEPRWISVKDRLPDKRPFLCYQPPYKLAGCNMPGGFRLEYNIGSHTHWMELPDPPLEGK